MVKRFLLARIKVIVNLCEPRQYFGRFVSRFCMQSYAKYESESVKAKNKGRPTKIGQLHIQKTLRPYFERGLTATFTAEKTGINIKTVCRYFDDWFYKLRELEAKDLRKREKKEREMNILSFNQLIFEAYELFDHVDSEIEKIKSENNPIPRYLLSFKLEIIKSIANLNERKRSFTIQHIPNRISKELETEEIDEELVKEIVRHLTLERGVTLSTTYSADDIIRGIINLLKCDDNRAKGILEKMKELGLSRCRGGDTFIDIDSTNEYHLLHFARIRGYVKEKEISNNENQN